jgi:hypothetical protein
LNMLIFGALMFLSAFLLFVVQPLIGKYILPWFGGTPAVWTACMLFFQALLLAGYAYAHALANRRPLRRQALVHLLLAAVTILALPIIPSAIWKPLNGTAPIPRILGLLLVSIGAPYFLLSATAPLLQSWFGRIQSGVSPYRLYALSNLGSLLAILGYPFLVEPALSLSRQAAIWSWSYAVFALLCILLSLKMLGTRVPETQGPVSAIEEKKPDASVPGAGLRILWLSLTTCSSVMLLATTNQMCQDVAVIPLLWILPLALYLLSYILCFQNERLYWRPLFISALAGSIIWTCFVLFGSVFVGLRLQILCYSLTLFTSCMVCHGELVRLKPGSRHLTSFYLMVACGGVLGGVLVTLAAPRLLKDFWEYHIGLLFTVLLVMIVLFRDSKGPLYRGRPPAVWVVFYLAFIALAVVLANHVRDSLQNTLETTRNFFGVLRVLELNRENPGEHRLTLMHGRIEHGFQFFDAEKRYWPTSYFGPDSGVGLAISYNPRRMESDYRRRPLRIGVVGLGTGTIATYGEEGDYIRFYEINPEVIRISDQYFTYRKDSPARIAVVLGDARISLERERQRREPQRFDVLAIDAFTSDAIPVHLLTRECLETYLYHLKADGILAVHISNRYFDLSPVVRNMAVLNQASGMQALWIAGQGVSSRGTDSTDWVLLTANRQFLDMPEIQEFISPWDTPTPRHVVWTDDYTNLFSLLRK